MRDIFAAILALVLIGALIVLIGGLMFYPVAMEAAQTQLLNTFMGMLATMVATVVAFYFGSSSSGKVKDDTIQTLAKSSPSSPSSPTVATAAANMAANTAANTASTTENTIKTAENTAAVRAASDKAEGEGE